MKTFQKLNKYLIKTSVIDENVCDWFVNNRFSIHFGDDKTKLILFSSKRRAKNISKLNIRYEEINIKQKAQVTYLG